MSDFGSVGALDTRISQTRGNGIAGATPPSATYGELLAAIQGKMMTIHDNLSRFESKLDDSPPSTSKTEPTSLGSGPVQKQLLDLVQGLEAANTRICQLFNRF